MYFHNPRLNNVPIPSGISFCFLGTITLDLSTSGRLHSWMLIAFLEHRHYLTGNVQIWNIN